MKNLTSKDDKKVLAELEKADSKGDIKWVKPLLYAFRDRKNKKRAFRSLWIARISAALNDHEISYSRFINNLSKSDIKLDRKILSGIAYSDPTTFSKIVDKVRL